MSALLHCKKCPHEWEGDPKSRCAWCGDEAIVIHPTTPLGEMMKAMREHPERYRDWAKTAAATEEARSPEEERCPRCAGPVDCRMVDDKMELLTSAGMAVIPVRQPVYSCSPCGDSFTNWEGEDAREAARQAFMTGDLKPLQFFTFAEYKALRAQRKEGDE